MAVCALLREAKVRILETPIQGYPIDSEPEQPFEI